MLCVTQRSGAQLPPYPVPLSNTEDARTLPKGIVLFRALNAWTRINDVYDAAADSAHHLHPLGHAFSVEPCIYFPGRFGMRLEDIVVATDEGPLRLNDAPRDIAIVA